MRKTLKSFFSLIYPELCCCCKQSLVGDEKHICTSCHYKLPKTNFHKDSDNAVELIFRGRVPVESAASYLYFQKGSSVQHLIHNFKYKGNVHLGYHLGKVYGNELKSSDIFSKAELIVPIPMHPAKQKKRGFNQSEVFARGIAEAMQIPIDVSSLVKKEKTQTQTKKSRFVRWENVETVFSIKDPEVFKSKHILLVDDVVTTGATIEACAQKLLKIEGVSLSIITLAIAS